MLNCSCRSCMPDSSGGTHLIHVAAALMLFQLLQNALTTGQGPHHSRVRGRMQAHAYCCCCCWMQNLAQLQLRSAQSCVAAASAAPVLP
jgi:hypothetical protein